MPGTRASASVGRLTVTADGATRITAIRGSLTSHGAGRRITTAVGVTTTMDGIGFPAAIGDQLGSPSPSDPLGSAGVRSAITAALFSLMPPSTTGTIITAITATTVAHVTVAAKPCRATSTTTVLGGISHAKRTSGAVRDMPGCARTKFDRRRARPRSTGRPLSWTVA